MKRQRFCLAGWPLLLVALALVQPVAGQTNRVAASTRHTLWKVQGQTNTLYLMGSIHVLKQENYPLPAPLENAFSNAQVAVFETDIGQMSSPDIAFQLMSKAQLPEGQTLQDQLTPATYALLTNHAADAGMPLIMLQSFQPGFAAMLIEVSEMQKIGLDPEYGLDEYFFKRAKKEGKDIVPLETLDFQIGLVTGFSKEEGELIMKTTLEEIDQTKKELNEMLAAWQTGDADKLAKLLNEVQSKAPAIFKRLVTDRNRTWVPKLEGLMRSGKNVVVIVGAGHLVGPEGVVELLKKKGLKVTQL